MGVVYKAEDMRLKRIVAIKFLPFDLTRDPESKERFVQEARAASALQHPAISTIHDLDETPDGQLFIVEEYYGGKTLKEILHLRQRVNLEEALNYAIQIARGLAEVHRKGIVHRDVKPSNIIIGEDGAAKIVDFGLAKLLDSSTVTRQGTTLGTPAYMSPEQLRGAHTSKRTDIWSLGVVLYEMLTGHRPFESDFEEGVSYAILHEDPVPARQHRPGLPPDIDRLLSRALQRDPEKRYPDMESLTSDLGLLKRGVRVTRLGSAIRAAVARKHTRRLALLFTPLVVVAIGIFLAKPALIPWSSEPTRRSIAVISCQDRTGEHLDAEVLFAVSDALTRYLSSIPGLEVSSVGRLDELARQRGQRRDPDTEEVPVVEMDLAGEVCRRQGIDGLLAPAVFKNPSGDYALSVELKDTRTNALLATAAAHAGPLEALMGAVRAVIDQTVAELDLPQPEAAAVINRVATLTTSSFEAYRSFAMARLCQANFRSEEFSGHILHALDHDSTFGAAYMILAQKEAAYLNFGRARSVLERATALGLLDDSPKQRHRMQMATLTWNDRYGLAALEERTALQRAYLESNPEDDVEHVILGTLLREQGLIEEAIRHQEIALDLNPQNAGALVELAWLHAYCRGELERGLRYANIVESFRPNTFGATGTRACIRYMMGDIEHAFYLQQVFAASAPGWNSCLLTSYISALQEDFVAAKEQHAIHMASADTPFFRGQGFLLGAYLDLWRGRLQESRHNLGRARAYADSTDNGSLRAEADWLMLWSSLIDPKAKGARPLASLWSESEGLVRICNPWYAYYRGMADLRAGRLDSLKAYADELEAREPSLIARDHPVSRSLSVLLRGERLLALDSVQAVLALAYAPPDFTTLVPHINALIEPGADGPRTSLLFSFSSDIEARAYLALGDTERAILDYERLVRREPSRRLWILSRHHFRLAQLYDRSGAHERATEQYEKFLSLWEQADTVFAEPRIARERLSVLKQEHPLPPAVETALEESAPRTTALRGADPQLGRFALSSPRRR